MSTRCNIHFMDGYSETVCANVYRHSDGYPEGVLPDLDKFFAEVERQAPGDTRFNDPEYLAARFVVWQAWEDAKYSQGAGLGANAPLDFMGVGVMTQDAGDAEYIYTVTCKDNGRPKVTYAET